jgi:hypothetical protein
MSYPDARYLGDEGEISAIYYPANREPDLTIGSSTVMHYPATGGSTNAQFGLYRVEMANKMLRGAGTKITFTHPYIPSFDWAQDGSQED